MIFQHFKKVIRLKFISSHKFEVQVKQNPYSQPSRMRKEGGLQRPRGAAGARARRGVPAVGAVHGAAQRGGGGGGPLGRLRRTGGARGGAAARGRSTRGGPGRVGAGLSLV